MKARLIVSDEWDLSDRERVQVIAWAVPTPLRGSSHSYKYRFAYVVDQVCVVRFDNEAGKGDHKHIGNREFPYRFAGIDDLLKDFWEEVENWQKRSGR